MSLSCLELRRFRLLLSVASLSSYALGVQAQALSPQLPANLRDPTMAPMQSGAAGLGIASVGSAGNPGFSIIVVSGRPHVIIGTRLYAQGQKLGGTRIERISETAVWLREDGQLRKISQFAGIERRSVLSAVSPACAANEPKGPKISGSSRNSSQANPCAGDRS